MIWRASVVLVWSIDKEYYPIIVGKVILLGMSKKVDIYIILRFYTFIYCATKIIIKYNDL